MKKKVESQLIFNTLKSVIKEELNVDNFYFACLGTDRSTGDSLGPLVGTALTKIGFKNVIGTLDDPLHAMNLDERLDKIDKEKYKIIAIDACLGAINSIGKFVISNEPLKPGAGVGKNLTPVGDYSITGVVNIGGYMEYFVLQNTRLSTVMKMAEEISNSLIKLFPLEVKG